MILQIFLTLMKRLSYAETQLKHLLLSAAVWCRVLWVNSHVSLSGWNRWCVISLFSVWRLPLSLCLSRHWLQNHHHSSGRQESEAGAVVSTWPVVVCTMERQSLLFCFWHTLPAFLELLHRSECVQPVDQQIFSQLGGSGAALVGFTHCCYPTIICISRAACNRGWARPVHWK